MKNRIISHQNIYSGWSSLDNYKLDVSDDPDKQVLVNREIYNSGNGAAVFLYNPITRKVIMTRQFRLAAQLNGHHTGMLIESCAGLLDGKDPEETIIREIWEETGIRIKSVEKVMESFASPGAHMEKIWFFTAEYREEDKKGKGGGLEEEHEEIEVLEFTYKELKELYNSGKLEDSKTIILVQYAIIKGIL